MEKREGKKLAKMLAGLTPPQASGILYSAAAVVPVLFSFVFFLVIAMTGLAATDGYAESDWYLYCSFLLPQISFAFIAALFIKSGQTSVKEIVTPTKWKYFLIAVVLQIGLLSLSELNTWFLELLGQIGYEDDGIAVPSMDGFGFAGVMFVIAVFPAVFEELIFRGLLLKGLKGFGEPFAILVCGALFALYHQNPAQTVYQFCCGAAFAFVAIRSGSILPTMLSHFLNNAWILIATKFSVDITPIYLPFMCVSTFCLGAGLTYLIFADKGEKREKQSGKRDFFLAAAVGILLCGLTWLSVLISGI